MRKYCPKTRENWLHRLFCGRFSTREPVFGKPNKNGIGRKNAQKSQNEKGYLYQFQ
jgi:hypothetical protein